MELRSKIYAVWPLVRRPDGGSHESLMRAYEREGTPTLARVKNKLLARVVAVVNKQQEYVKKSA